MAEVRLQNAEVKSSSRLSAVSSQEHQKLQPRRAQRRRGHSTLPNDRSTEFVLGKEFS